MEPIKPSEPVNFFAQAYENYICARLLLNKGRFVDGHILAQFSIEKYMKGLLLLKGQRFYGHDLTEANWLAGFHDMFPKLRAWLSAEFLTYLGNAFRLRYWDNQREIGNVMLFKLKVLLHLDNVVSIIEDQLLRRPPGKESQYYRDLKSNLSDLVENNAVVNSTVKYDLECYAEEIVAFVLDDNFNLAEFRSTLIDHRYSTGFPGPGHLKFVTRDERKNEIIFPSQTYPKQKGKSTI